jgi:hypothetical protein
MRATTTMFAVFVFALTSSMPFRSADRRPARSDKYMRLLDARIESPTRALPTIGDFDGSRLTARRAVTLNRAPQ